MVAVAVEGATFRYQGGSRPVLQDLDLRMEEGEFVLLTGPSGSGKSTVLRLLNGLIPHFYRGELAGTIRVLGTDTRAVRPNRLTPRVGTVFQFPEEQVVAARVWRDVAFGLENLLLPREAILPRVAEALDWTGLAPLRDREVTTLSGGEKQRLALAGVLALEPRLLLLDEPASELDPRGRREFMALLARLAADRSRTVILADHRLDDVAPLADRVVVLGRGRVVADGPPREVLADPLMEELGVEVPVAVRLWRRGALGPAEGTVPLTVEELAARWGTGGDRPGV